MTFVLVGSPAKTTSAATVMRPLEGLLEAAEERRERFRVADGGSG